MHFSYPDRRSSEVSLLCKAQVNDCAHEKRVILAFLTKQRNNVTNIIHAIKVYYSEQQLMIQHASIFNNFRPVETNNVVIFGLFSDSLSLFSYIRIKYSKIDFCCRKKI